MEKITLYDWMRMNTRILTLLPEQDREQLKGMTAEEMKAYIRGYRSALKATERATVEVKGNLVMLETMIELAKKLQRDGYVGGE